MTCPHCGFKGVPTLTGGRRVGPLRNYGTRRYPNYGQRVVGSTATCVDCQRELPRE